jgi:F0F1-type ATP synthase delta subunit
MFSPERWALAFTNAAGEDAEGAFASLQVLVPPLQSIKGAVRGAAASKQIEGFIRRAVPLESRQMEIALRFAVLLIRRNGFIHIGPVCRAIETALDRKNGVITAIVETAQPLDEAYQGVLRERIRAWTGAAGVKLRVCHAPELLGGYRVRAGSECWDASALGQVRKMALSLGK